MCILTEHSGDADVAGLWSHWEQPGSGLGIWAVSDFVAQMAVFKTLGSQLNIDGLTEVIALAMISLAPFSQQGCKAWDKTRKVKLYLR